MWGFSRRGSRSRFFNALRSRSIPARRLGSSVHRRRANRPWPGCWSASRNRPSVMCGLMALMPMTGMPTSWDVMWASCRRTANYSPGLWRRTSRALPKGRTLRTSSKLPRRRDCMTWSCACRKVTTPRSAMPGRFSPVDNASASPLLGPCSAIRKSSSWTNPTPVWTPAAITR